MLDRFESQLSRLQTQCCCCIIKLKLEVWRLRTFSLGHKERKILGGFLMMMPTLLQDHNLHKWIFHLMPFNFTQLSHHDITKSLNTKWTFFNGLEKGQCTYYKIGNEIKIFHQERRPLESLATWFEPSKILEQVSCLFLSLETIKGMRHKKISQRA